MNEKIMTKKDRELLFIDLCARLPYVVKIEVIEDNDFKDVEVLDCYYLNKVNNKHYSIRPYLFPLSSMTEEQKKELGEMTQQGREFINKKNIKS